MNYKDLFCILGGIFNFEIIMSFAAYDAIEMILNYKKKFLNLTLFEAAFVIFCWPKKCSAKILKSVCVRPISRSPNQVPKWISVVIFAAEKVVRSVKAAATMV